MTLYFVTGNRNKFAEVQLVLGGVTMHDVDLDEIQALDPHAIIQHKVEQAKKEIDGPFIVEDTALYIDGMNGLPGPLLKWFLEAIGNEGIARLTKLFGERGAAKTIFGYFDGEKTHFFEGAVHGKIVKPEIEAFGWDDIFLPDGQQTTYAKLGIEEKSKISHRTQALKKLKQFLEP